MKGKFYVICDNIRSLENIGSIFRTADALGVDKIFLCGISGCPPNKKISKASLGAEKNISFEYSWQVWKIIDKIKKSGIKIVSLEKNKNSVVYTDFQPEFPLALVVGNEIKGVSQSVLRKSDKIISLPMLGEKESLNVSVAFGVAGYHINNFRK